MQEILVAVDGSKQSEQVVDSAIDLAKRTSLPILLVYVMKDVREEPEAVKEFEKVEHFHDAYANYLKEIGDSVTGRMTERIEKSNISCRTIVELGNPAERILKIADDSKSSFVVVGLKGLHGVERIRSLGSVSRRIVENAHCPVMVVPS